MSHEPSIPDTEKETGKAVATPEKEIDEKVLPEALKLFREPETGKMTVLAEADFEGSATDIVGALFDEKCSFFPEYHKLRGDTELVLQKWQHFGTKFGSIRKVDHRSPVHVPFAPKSTHVAAIIIFYGGIPRRLLSFIC